MDQTINKSRLYRAICGLQLIQRSNPPNSSIAKAAAKGLAPLLKEMATMEAQAPDALPLERAT